MTAVATAGVLEAHNISKSFPGVHALQDVSLRLEAGKLVALLGENGAGKSTLMNVLSGVISADGGEIAIDGRVMQFRHPSDARRSGIATIYQELGLSTNLTIAENIFLGEEPTTRWGTLDYERMHRTTRELLSRMSLDIEPNVPLGSLRVGQQQVVEIARALAANARVIIMDEPTSALAYGEIESLLCLVRELKAAGVAIVYITHKLEELDDLADEVAIMRDGQMITQAPYESLTRQEIVSLMVGRAPTAFHERHTHRSTERPVLRVQQARLPHPARRGDYLVRDVDLHVARGEVLGIFGLMGAGRTELLETIFGLHASTASITLSIDDREMQFASPAQAIAAGLAFAPEDRKHDGLVLDMSSQENVTLACLSLIKRWGLLDTAREAESARAMLERIRWRGASLQGPVRNLSGGNQQKVILAKWLATRPKVLLLDEPTRGIDINARNEIYLLIEQLVAEGLSIVMVSSELPEILALSDRILVMCQGVNAGEFSAETATAEAIMKAALPSSTRLRT
jgi:ABC-type sugar transport system ATPase subunit